MKRNKMLISFFVVTMVLFLAPKISYALSEFEPNKVIGNTNWEGTFVYDEKGNDVTHLNSNFIGRAKYDTKTNRYEFFDKVTNEPRGDRGVFFITQDGRKRILMSQTANYNAVVDMVRLDKDMFTYRRNGKQLDGTDGNVFVEHVPYQGTLNFSFELPVLSQETGVIDKSRPGRDILSSTLWQGTVALDEDGKDVSDSNKNYLGLARYDSESGRYEFFNNEGQSRNDYGYFDVINGNKERTHFSLGRYAATLELTELNTKRFTYSRMGKDDQGKDIKITVEHERYTGDQKLDFTFGNEAVEPIVMPPLKTGKDDQMNSNAIIEVDSPMMAGTVKFAQDANIEASVVFEKINTKNKPEKVHEKEKGRSKISIVDTRKNASETDLWSVKTKLTDGHFGNKGFITNKLSMKFSPTSNDQTISVTGPVEINGGSEKEVFTIGFDEVQSEQKDTSLNPELMIGDLNLLNTGVYGANAVWTLTPKV